ncbi:3',5'-nucleoside bisphosphate phosphatase [Methyloversatilis thermotolerans]|uniref:3',5'-nucleoside bisphosphate phosphatase n=1 Tax=Methyloversatilis thermotolerans TaxID=1346290 RepID=UPI00036AA452|nr:3',5'-nucleoside bisphosphate phosphatase [Methyloversatilis thermotolerans]
MNADLHCHSCHSDGLLSPVELARRAHANGVNLWALTDHDNLGGLAEARAEAVRLGLDFVDGVEISVTWMDMTIHVVGLAIDPRHAPLSEGLAQVRSGRDARALRMAEALELLGVRDAYQNALRLAGNPSLVGRSHFARVLVEQGYAADVHAVFRSYLVRGRPGYVEHRWTSLACAVQWIRGAGGVAVIAHPGRYRLSGDQMRRLLAEFQAAGGEAIEVVSGSHGEPEMRAFARMAREFGFYASRASDFHAPDESPVDLGRGAPLPDGLTAVWHAPALRFASEGHPA